jgi:acyl-CoA thioesterase
MTSLTHKAQERFAHDRYATEATGVKIDEVREGYARCSLTLTPHHRNAMGAVMGGVMFTLADLAFAVAANSQCLDDDAPLQWVSLSSSIQYLGQTRGSNLFAETTCVKQGNSTCVYTISICDEHNRQIALVTFTGMKIAIS